MGIEFREGRIIIEKELSYIDRLVLDFVSCLDGIRYVIVSGYTALLLGRSRSTEDIDFILADFGEREMKTLLQKLEKAQLWVVNPGSPEELLSLMRESNARIARKGEGIPNIEIKFTKDNLDTHALTNAKEVMLDGFLLKISPLELQIAYKLFLGSEKDLEDARHIFNICRNNIDMKKLDKFMSILKIKDSIRRTLGD